MILRDRNHPSIIIWSMCNEEVHFRNAGGREHLLGDEERVHCSSTRPVPLPAR